MITQEQVRKLFDYNPETGRLTRKISASNQIAGTVCDCIGVHGYLMIGIDGKTCKGHRIIFLHVHGYLPNEVDHINNIKDDNRISNLRASSRTQNNRNRRASNKSGVKNVYKQGNKWRVLFTVNKENLHIGYFDSLKEAEKAAIKARIELHGEFANHG